MYKMLSITNILEMGKVAWKGQFNYYVDNQPEINETRNFNAAKELDYDWVYSFIITDMNIKA